MSPYRINITALLLFLTVILNAQNTSQHIVKRGETFASIANKYGISEQQLKTANSKNKICYSGLILTIPSVNVSNNTETKKKSIKNKCY